MRIFLVIISIFALSACDPRTQAVKGKGDAKSILDMLSGKDGPKVEGVEATLLQSAQDAEEKRQYERALQFYRQLRDSDKRNERYMLGVADNLRRTDQIDDALDGYEEILKKSPDNVEALEGKGLALMAKGDLDEARPVFQDVLKQEPNRWRTLNAIGVLFVLKKMPKEGLAYFNEGLKARPDEPAILNNVGLTLALNEEYDRAIKSLQRASRKLPKNDPQKERVDLNLALVYGLSGDMDAAEDVAGKYLNDAALDNNLGFYASLADNKDLAKAYLNSALSGSSVFYDKAWNNLEAIGGSTLREKKK